MRPDLNATDVPSSWTYRGFDTVNVQELGPVALVAPGVWSVPLGPRSQRLCGPSECVAKRSAPGNSLRNDKTRNPQQMRSDADYLPPSAMNFAIRSSNTGSGTEPSARIAS
jgi:hypothetical protein